MLGYGDCLAWFSMLKSGAVLTMQQAIRKGINCFYLGIGCWEVGGSHLPNGEIKTQKKLHWAGIGNAVRLLLVCLEKRQHMNAYNLGWYMQ